MASKLSSRDQYTFQRMRGQHNVICGKQIGLGGKVVFADLTGFGLVTRQRQFAFLSSGAPAADPADLWFCGFSIFRKISNLESCPSGFGVWGGLQSMRNGCGLQTEGFSRHFDPSEPISVYLHGFSDFGIISSGLTVFPEDPKILRDRPEGARTL